MKQLRLTQNLLRLLVALLAIVMLFIPWFSVKVNTLTKERIAQITAMGLIAVDRGDMTQEEFLDLMEQIAPIAAESAVIATGYTPDGDDLPFDFLIHSMHPEYLIDSKYPEDLADKVYPVQSEIGDGEDKVEISFSFLSTVKALVSGGGFALRLITTPILEEGELEDTEGMSEEQIAEIAKKVAENREKSGFSDALIGKLKAIGVENSETWVYLSKLDTTKFNEEVMDLVWLICSFASFTVIATLFMLIVIPITLFVLALSEIIKLLKNKFDEQGVAEGCNAFQYGTVLGIILALAFLDKGANISPLIYVLAALMLGLAVFYSFTEGKAKQGKGCGIFYWGIRAISLLCVVACVIAFSAGMGINAFETIVTEDNYEESFEKIVEKHEGEMENLSRQLVSLEKQYEENHSEDTAEAIKNTEKQIEILNARIRYESVNDILMEMQWLKLLVTLYLIMVASYFTNVLDRLGSMRSIEFPMALVSAKYVGRIVCIVFAAAVEILVFGGLITPFVWFFTIFAVLEIVVAIFKKVARKFEYNYVVSKGQELSNSGVIPEDSWNAASEQLTQMGAHATSLKTAAVVDTVDVLLDEYLIGEQAVEELGEKLREAFAVDAEAKKKRGERKNTRRR